MKITFNQQFLSLVLSLVLGLAALPVQAVVILKEYGFNVDGTYTSDAAPFGVNLGAFDTLTGLGSITATLGGAGNHFFGGFFDHEINQAISTPFNETGSTTGAPAAGQSWEIDEPGFGSPTLGSAGVPYFGDIFTNISSSDPSNSDLDNQVFYDAFDNQTLTPPDDVSMAMGWLFNLMVDEMATINLVISSDVNDMIAPFYLQQTDLDSGETLFFSGSLAVSAVSVPEPSSLLLFTIGLFALRGFNRKRRV